MQGITNVDMTTTEMFRLKKESVQTRSSVKTTHASILDTTEDKASQAPGGWKAAIV